MSEKQIDKLLNEKNAAKMRINSNKVIKEGKTKHIKKLLFHLKDSIIGLNNSGPLVECCKILMRILCFCFNVRKTSAQPLFAYIKIQAVKNENTEFRVFFDFDTNKVVTTANYWDYDYCIDYMYRADKVGFEQAKKLLEQDFNVLRPRLEEKCETMLSKVEDLKGIWSVDFMWTGTEFVLIDMAPGEKSAYWDKAVEAIRKQQSLTLSEKIEAAENDNNQNLKSEKIHTRKKDIQER